MMKKDNFYSTSPFATIEEAYWADQAQVEAAYDRARSLMWAAWKGGVNLELALTPDDLYEVAWGC